MPAIKSLRKAATTGQAVGGGGGQSRSSLASAIAAHAAGYRARPPVVFYIADSNGTGEGAGDGTGTVPKLTRAFSRSPFQQLAAYLSILGGLPIRNGCFFGEGNSGNNGAPVSEYDPRLTLGTGWARSGSAGPIGGQFLIGSAGSSGDLVFAPGYGFDTVEVHYPVNTGSLSSSVGVYASDGTQVGTYSNIAGAAGVSSATFTSPKFADGIVKIRNLSGSGAAYVTGAMCWSSSEKCVLLAQGTRSAAKASDIASPGQAWDGINHLDTIKPDACAIALTINDINAGTAAATYNTELAKIVARADKTAAGSILLATSGPGNNANYGNSVWTDIEAEMVKIARTYGASILSMHKELVSWAAANGAGLIYDGSHGNAAQYAIVAQRYAAWLQRLVA